MNREHAIAFRDGLLDIAFEPSASKNMNDAVKENVGGGTLEDLEITLEIIQKANGASDMDDDPLAATTSNPEQTLK